MIVFACISPHPPLILPNVGSSADREKVKKTISSLQSLALKLAKAAPQILIISSPHPDWGINVPLCFLSANLGSQKLQLKIQGYQEANNFVIDSSANNAIYPILTTLDNSKRHYEWGEKIAKSLPKEKRIAWIASGDMSHRLKEEGPYGFDPSGPKYDREFIKLLREKDIDGILNMNPHLVEEAGECGLRSLCMLLGVLEESKTSWQPEILSYEGPFGVGYLVANLLIRG